MVPSCLSVKNAERVTIKARRGTNAIQGHLMISGTRKPLPEGAAGQLFEITIKVWCHAKVFFFTLYAGSTRIYRARKTRN